VNIDIKLLREQIIALNELISDLPSDHILWGALILLEAIYDRETE
jgi:hypothetical protein